MAELSIERVTRDDDRAIVDWRNVHNEIIPTAVPSLEEVRERADRDRLDVVHEDGVLVGCATVRPPAGEEATADGPRFAPARGFVETERHVLPGDTIPFVTLRPA